MSDMNLLSYALLLFSLGLINCDCVSSQRNAEECSRGKCISINLCPSLLNLLQRNRPPSPNIISGLRQFHCGFDGIVPRVCCFNNVTTTSRSKLPSECGTTIAENKITLGDNSNLYEFPWMALIGYSSDDGIQYRCGGSLINHRYVLTAAHCMVQNVIPVKVRLGEYDLNTDIDCEEGYGCALPAQDVDIEDIILHPDYVSLPKPRHDIALIRLKRDIIFSDAIRPICLPIGRKEQLQSLEGQKMTVTGWGVTNLGKSSPVLQKVKLPIVSLERCIKIYNGKFPLDISQICAGGSEGKDSCNGDSGGPMQSLMQRDGRFVFLQHGLVSFGPRNCGTPGLPGVYTRVGYYMPWILDTIRP